MAEILDENGLTEKEFIARYDASRFERPSVTVDINIAGVEAIPKSVTHRPCCTIA